jgi:hypothetical protein
MATALLVFGVYVFAAAAKCASSASIECHRDRGGVICELRKMYPGGVAWTDRFQLSSAAVRPVTSWSRTGSRSYELLVLNSELEVGSSDEANGWAERMNELLDGRATDSGTIELAKPWYGGAFVLSALATLLSGAGALLLWGVFSEGRRRPARE